MVSIKVGVPDLASHPGVWRHLQRLPAAVVSKSLPTDQRSCHYFGDDLVFERCSLLLACSATGQLAAIWHKPGRHWLSQDIPEEQLGRGVLHPSVRFVLATPADQVELLQILNRMLTAVQAQSRPSVKDASALVLLLSRSPCPAKAVPVSVLPNIAGSLSESQAT